MINMSRFILRRSKSNFLIPLRNYKIQSSNLHLLCVRQSRSSIASTSILSPEISQIIARFESSETGTKDFILNPPQAATLSAESISSDGLPDIPTLENTTSDIPEIVAEVVVPLNKLGEPTLQSLELGCYWTPVGWVQNCLEWMHCTLHLPWWASISACVVIARLLLFPLVIKGQKSNAKMHNVMPEMREIQERLQNARTYGNDVEAMKIGFELADFMKKKNINPASSFGLPLVQAPVFLSFFWGLRSMANTPVESFKHGGLWWFEDLTLPDPFFILPTITCVSLFFTIYFGADFQQQAPSSHPLLKHTGSIFKVIPVVVFPFIMYFPSAVLCYWGTANIVSLVQVLFLRIPKVRTYFDIEVKQKREPSAASSSSKTGVVKGLKSSWKNMQIAREIEERDRLDEMCFKRAGRAPPAKTFKENPLLNKESLIQAKKN